MLAIAAVVVALLAYEFIWPPVTRHSRSPAASPPSVATATVERRTIASRTEVDGTLTYAHDYSVVNQLGGYFTKLPTSSEGQVIEQGEVLYEVGAVPVVLLDGAIPAWRDLSAGETGKDVTQLNDDLMRLGLLDKAGLKAPDAFGPATERAVKVLQSKIGATPSGMLAFGAAVFLPSPIRIVSVSPAVGTRAAPDSVIMQATSTERQVTTQLTASQLDQVKVGDDVTITLDLGGPNQRTVAGKISKLDTTATAGSGANGSAPTFEVDVSPSQRAALGRIDQMPVQVGITTATAKNALVVPVTALLSTSSQGYAVEAVAADGTHTRIPVQLGIFDDADGLVQVSGSGLEAGQKIVVPAL